MIPTLRLFLAVILLPAFGVAEGILVSGRVVDSTGAGISGGTVRLHNKETGGESVTSTDYSGRFRFEASAGGTSTITASSRGLAPAERELEVRGPLEDLELVLTPASLAQEVIVSANLIVGSSGNLARIPGSADLLDAQTMRESRLFTFEEALRKVAGVNSRPEEGFGLRPNIGLRGLNPTRSSRVLLLEDGVPLAYAPYGDNASYYHPPVDRFDGIEVVKGSGQILYGPMTVGGVINYVTPSIPDQRSGSVTLIGGSRDYLNGHFRYGGTFRDTGLLFDYVRKQGEGARDNVRSGLNDVNLKMLTPLSPGQTLSLKANYYNEDSNLTYSGLRRDEYLANPRQNPFRNDYFYGKRYGLSGAHAKAFTDSLILTTTVYGSLFFRDWWRQSSNSGQRPNDSADPACGGMANLNTTCGIEGRLRSYYTWGVEPRFKAGYAAFGSRSEADFGFRAHFERQERKQENGNLPASRTGVLVEDNQRRNQAYSGYLQNRFVLGNLSLIPGVRLEHVRYRRINRLFDNGAGVTGKTTLTQAIPGIGAAWSPFSAVTVFTGLHRGFAPPRTEDIISNAGGFIELDPELSWNYEAGARVRLRRHLSLEGTFFRMDYENQVVPASLAGGVGAALTNAGETLHEGAELAGRWDVRNIFRTRNHIYLRGAYMYLPVTKFTGRRFSSVAGSADVSVTGNRLPYAPRSLLNAIAGWSHSTGIHAFLEAVHTGRQFADDLNTVNATPDGQRGAIPGHVLWNATLNVPFEGRHTSLFLTVKNLLDRTVIVDRSRGILPNSPRLIQTGVQFSF